MTDAEYAVVLLRDLPETVPPRMILQSFRKLVQARARYSENTNWTIATVNMQDVERIKMPVVRDAAWERARKAVARIAIGLPPEKIG
jgi:hypothetical protein